MFQALSWHHGEEKIHKLTHLPPHDNPTHSFLPAHLARRVALSPTIAIGTTDDSGNVWCTLWGGDVPIAQQVAQGGVLGVRVKVDASFDPVVEAIYQGKHDGDIVRPEGKNAKMISGLSILLEERDRVKLFGTMLAGALSVDQESSNDTTDAAPNDKNGKIGNAQLVFQVSQSLGNCPKYLNKKTIKGSPESRPRLVSNSAVLTQEAIDHVHSADILFVASTGPEDMDCNHRGGSPGFIRVDPSQNEADGSVLVWPEYSGNNLYQTLGNIMHAPNIGVVIPNLATGDVLYVSGDAEVLVNQAAAEVISKSKLAVRVKVRQARFVKEGLMFRGTPVDSKNGKEAGGYSPYNPRIRHLASEVAAQSALTSGLPPDEYRPRGSGSDFSAVLVKKIKLTPTITKYRFKLTSDSGRELPRYLPGQYAVLDFSEELYMGYSHMRDDDPVSLNDDFIRSFTISSRHGDEGNSKLGKDEFEMIIRSVGSVTKWLAWQNEGRTVIGTKGFEGEFRFEMPNIEAGGKRKRNVFIAAGIGITPLLSQMADMEDHLIVLWTLSNKDSNLAAHVLKGCSDRMRRNMRIFLTGSQEEAIMSEESQEVFKQTFAEGLVKVQKRRITKEDVLGVEDDEIEVDRWYLCMAPNMRKQVQDWLGEKPVIFENFDY